MISEYSSSEAQDAAFQKSIREEKINSTRVITILGSLLYVIYSIIDYFGLSRDVLMHVYTIRGFAILNLIIIFLLTFKPVFIKHFNRIVMFGYFYAGTAICMTIFISQPDEYSYNLYFAALMVLMMTAFSWSYLPIKYSMLISVVFMAVIVGIKVFVHKDLETNGVLSLIANLFFLTSVGVIAASAQMIRDHLIYNNFLLHDQLRVIAEQKSQEAKKHQKLANRDALTGIPNRRSITNALQKALVDAKQTDCKIALIFIDLNGFKNINDVYGHDAGDKILQITAKRLAQTIRRGDYLARLGGDEFLIGFKTSKNADRIIDSISKKLRSSITSSIAFNGNLLKVGVSLGSASYPADGDSIDELIKIADQKMYADKQVSKGIKPQEHKTYSSSEKATTIIYPR